MSLNRGPQITAGEVARAPLTFFEELWDAIGKTFLSPTEAGVQESINKIKFIIGIVIVIAVIGIVIGYAYQKGTEQPLPATQNVALMMSKRLSEMRQEKELLGTKSLYGGIIPTIPENQRYLINFIPLTARLGGYIGGNVFNSGEYIQRALRAGIRSFILPISVYMDDNKRPPNWPLSGKPAIVSRDIDGKITSVNALTVSKFCTELMTFKAQNPAQAEEPYIVYLEEDERYTPDHTKQEKEYVQLMSELAKELNSISGSRIINLGIYGSGTAGGTNGAKILLETRMEDLRGKVILMSNFDTKIQLKDAYKNITPRLHEYINIAYKPNMIERIEIGQAYTKGYEDKTRIVWNVASKDNEMNIPKIEDVRKAIEVGIQGIPVPYFSMSNKLTEEIHKEWNGYSMRVKAEGLRYMKPTPVVPKMPKETLNARVEGAKQPGQIIIR